MSTTVEISVIIPAYNEEGKIGKTIREVRKLFNNLGIEHEIIVVDDGSTDNTFKEATSERFDNVKVVGYKQNKGKGYAIRYGLRFASKQLVTFLDADMELDPKQISVLIEYMKKSGADVVVGSKRHPLSKIEYYPFVRKFLSKVYNSFLRLVLHINVRDTQAGFKLIKREVLERIVPLMKIKRFAFDVELLAYARVFGYKIVEAPIVLKFSRKKWGRITLKTILNIFFDTMVIACRLRILQYYSKFLRDTAALLFCSLLGVYFYKQFVNPYAFPGVETRILAILLIFCFLIVIVNFPYEAFARKLE